MDVEAWRETILAFLWSHPRAQVFEDGELLFDFTDARAHLAAEHGKLLLQLWSTERNWVRRVMGITSEAPARLVLLTQKFGQSRPGRLELIEPHGFSSPRASDRRRFQQTFRRLLERNFPDEEVISLSHAADLEHSLSGLYLRGEMGHGRSRWAVIAPTSRGPENSQRQVDGILTSGLIWLDRLRSLAGRGSSRSGSPGKTRLRVVEGLRIFVPSGCSSTTANRLAWINRRIAKFELYEVDEDRLECRAVDATDWGNVETRLVPHGLEERLGPAQQERIARVRALAPEAIQVTTRAAREVVLRFRGLEFARLSAKEAVFGVGAEENSLSEENFAEFERLVGQLIAHRRANPADRTHPLYRLQAERWLESLLVGDIAQVDARLDSRFVYPQVPAVSGSDRGVIDILSATRDGRLAVLELKADEDIHLPLQGLDYWLRVRWHLDRGEFQRYGYFRGRMLRPEPPLLYLVAPAFSFHSATDCVLRYLSEEVPVTRVGLNENWREGLQVVLRQ